MCVESQQNSKGTPMCVKSQQNSKRTHTHVKSQQNSKRTPTCVESQQNIKGTPTCVESQQVAKTGVASVRQVFGVDVNAADIDVTKRCAVDHKGLQPTHVYMFVAGLLSLHACARTQQTQQEQPSDLVLPWLSRHEIKTEKLMLGPF